MLCLLKVGQQVNKNIIDVYTFPESEPTTLLPKKHIVAVLLLTFREAFVLNMQANVIQSVSMVTKGHAIEISGIVDLITRDLRLNNCSYITYIRNIYEIEE